MRVLIVLDKFKGALDAPQACDLVARALYGSHRDWQFDSCPLTDGGEGFAGILTQTVGGQQTSFKVAGPRGALIDADVGLVPLHKVPLAARRLLQWPAGSSPSDRPVAVLEMAAASGLRLLAPSQYDPWQTTTYGTGQLLRAAAESGAAAILLGVGGSATSDLGFGALAALGLEFRGASGEKIRPPIPSRWEQIARLEGSVFPSIPPICIACDVTNPLLGPRGAAAVYGPQKGLRPEDLPRLETEAARMAHLLCEHCGRPPALTDTPGAGAAGGLAFGLLAGARARLVPGFELVSAWLDLPARLAAADIVITGEGCFDQSSLSGKGPGAVAAQAAALGKAVHVFAGKVADALPRNGWHLHAITPDDYPLERALREAPELLRRSVQAAFPN